MSAARRGAGSRGPGGWLRCSPRWRPSVAGAPAAGPLRPSCPARRWAVMCVPRSAGGGECPAERRGVSQRRGGRAGGRAMESSAPRRREGRAV